MPTTTKELQDDLRVKVKNLESGWKRLRSNSVSPISGRRIGDGNIKEIKVRFKRKV